MNVTRGAICRLDLFGRTPVQPLKASLEHEGDPHGPADQAQSTTRLPLTRLTGRTDGRRRSSVDCWTFPLHDGVADAVFLG